MVYSKRSGSPKSRTGGLAAEFQELTGMIGKNIQIGYNGLGVAAGPPDGLFPFARTALEAPYDGPWNGSAGKR